MRPEPLNVPIAVIPKNSRQEVRVALREFRGAQFCDVRIFAEFAGTTDARSPTKEGVAVAFDKLPDMIAALQDAQAMARELGLVEVEP